MANILEFSSVSNQHPKVTEPQTVSTEKAIQLSVVIPMYNQEKNASLSLSRIREVLDAALLSYEIVVVNDGSSDNTAQVLHSQAAADGRIRVISYSANRGKGYAVRTGVMLSRGNVVVFTDGDLDVSPIMIKKYVDELQSCDLVIASKRHFLSKVNAPLSRKFLSRMFNVIVRIFTGIKIKDTQSGLKAGNGEVLRTIFKVMLVKRYAFDVELLTIASILHLKINELPIEIYLDRGFKMREIIKMLIDVMAISYRYRIIHWYQKRLAI